jgi:hypothetical protein
MILAISISMVGCFPLIPSDGGFSAIGYADCENGQQNLECLLVLLDSNGKPINARNVSGRFQVHYTVPPLENSYTMKVSCNNGREKTIEFTYGREVTPDHPLDIGSIP